MSEEYKPRFSFEISEEQKDRANRLIYNYGLRKAIFSTLLDDVLDLIEEHGNIVVGILLDKSIRPHEIMPSMKEAERRAKGES